MQRKSENCIYHVKGTSLPSWYEYTVYDLGNFIGWFISSK